jgi:hypothetical protein
MNTSTTTAAVREGPREWTDWWVREPRSAHTTEVPSERHLQCVWYDPTFHPPKLKTSKGEPVVIEHPGQWNLEAGPDFLGAAVCIGDPGHRVVGDVEVHVHPADWLRHAHRDDPAYSNVRFHVTYFDEPPMEVPGAIWIPMRPALRSWVGFTFEAIDVTAYPYAARSKVPPCAELVRSWPVAAQEEFLHRAGVERLRSRAAQWAHRVAILGVEEAVYTEFMAALGYKRNQAPMRWLARRVPWSALNSECEGDPERAYALLMGAAGLLDPTGPEMAPPRWIWDLWWKMRARWEACALSRNAWHLDSTRPLNRPELRLRAAAIWCTRSPMPAWEWLRMADESPSRWIEEILQTLLISDPWASGTARRVLGPDRAAAILVNVVVPFLISQGRLELEDPRWMEALPLEVTNSIEREMAFRLLGPDHPPSVRRSTLRRQGLLHLFHEYCLVDRTDCQECPIVPWLKKVQRKFMPTPHPPSATSSVHNARSPVPQVRLRLNPA